MQFTGEMMFVAVLSAPAIVALVIGRLNQTRIKTNAVMTPSDYWGVYAHSSKPVQGVGVRLPDVPDEEIESITHHHTIGVHP